MIEAWLALLIGGALARAVVWPLQMALQDRREAREWAVARRLADEAREAAGLP